MKEKQVPESSATGYSARWLLIVAAIVGVIGIVVLRHPDNEAEQILARRGSDLETTNAPSSDNQDHVRKSQSDARNRAGQSVDPKRTPRVVRAESEKDTIPHQPFAPHQYDMQRMQIFGEFWRSAEEEWTADRYAAAENDKESLDAEQTYQVYVYLRTCLDSPRNETQAMARFDRVEEAMLRNPRLAEDRRVERWMERVEEGLVRCLGLEEDLELLTLDWLISAAMRGYPLAQIAYYRSYRWILMREPTLLTRDPSLVTYYHSLAPRLLTTALQSGHPEAFAEVAQAYADGIIYQRDPLTAYAYVLAAREAGIETLDVAAQVESSVIDDLTTEDIQRARSMARDLCAQYCL